MSRTAATPGREPPRAPRVVSRPHDAAEQQADRAADVVARGGSVSGWSFRSVRAEADVHRQPTGPAGVKDDSEKLKEAAKKAGEAALETPAGKRFVQKVKEDPLVKAATGFLETTPGKLTAGAAIAGGVVALGAAGKPLPFQAPAIPLDRLTPGLSAQVTVEGPVNAPTFVGLSLTYKEQVAKGKGGPTEKEKIAADIARLKAEQQMFAPKPEPGQAKADEEAVIAYLLAQQRNRFGTSTLVPLLPGAKPVTVDAPKEAPPAEEEKKPEEAPVQRDPASRSEAPTAKPDASGVDAALLGGGRALDPALRHSMEARFGVDFASVRLHDGASSASAAARLDASAFTVGDDIVFGGAGPDPSTFDGRRLIAHELAHVVQQRRPGGARVRATGGAPPTHIHRRGVGEWLGILFGTTEGNWSDQELQTYLTGITSSGLIESGFQADNKARAVVRRWKAATPGYQLTGRQKGLLIDQMLDGPTGDDDELAILDLLELSDAGDLRTIFAKPQERWSDLESDLHGEEDDRLRAFVNSRFRGGAKALEAGKVTVIGAPVPKGAPVFAFDGAYFDARLDGDTTGPELIAIIDHLPAKDRRRAFDHLLKVSWPRAAEEQKSIHIAMLDAGAARKAALKARLKVVEGKLVKLKVIVSNVLGREVPRSEAELRAETAPLAAADVEAAKKVLEPTHAPLPEDVVESDEAAGVEPTGKKAAPKTPKERREAAERKREADEKRSKEEKKKFGPDSTYRKDTQAALLRAAEEHYREKVVEAGTRAPTDVIQPMAPVAKKAVDAVFGRFYDPNAPEHDVMVFAAKGTPGKLHSWYETYDYELHELMNLPQRRDEAKRWLLYYCQREDEIRAINGKYGASPTFGKDKGPTNEAARTLVLVAEELTKEGASKGGLENPKTLVDRLNVTKRAWKGMASGSEVYVELYQTGQQRKDREARWEMVQVLVHEYIHTLRSKEYDAYAESFGEKSVQNNTLIEGVDDVLSAMVWDHLAPKTSSKELREDVEGEEYAKLPPIDVPIPPHYPSFDEALRLAALVGIRNVMAAYFLGLVDRIGGPAAKEKPGAKGASKPTSKPGGKP